MSTAGTSAEPTAAAAPTAPTAAVAHTATTALTAAARLVAESDGRGGTVLPVLAGAGPIALRRTGRGPTAQVTMVGSMAAPLGGDRLALAVELRPGAALRVTAAAATISLPGPGPAHYDLDLSLAEDSHLDWLPEPVIAATGSHLVIHTRITLAPGATLRYREEQVLGRHHDRSRGAPPGRLTSRITVRRAGRLILDQQTDLGPGAPAWDGPATLGGHRTAGQLLTVGLPAPPSPPAADAALLSLPTPDATLLTALAPDALALRRLLRTE